MQAIPRDSQLMNYLVRMVVPIRREFGRQLDVSQFLHDVSYAREVLDLAFSSQDARLIDYARFVEKRLYGPRSDMNIMHSSGPPAQPIESDSIEQADAMKQSELRVQILKKYTEGLR